jgi:hypothetical protein
MHSTTSIEQQLQQVRDWASGKIVAGSEPPWAWKTYNDLIILLDDILGSMATTISIEDGRPLHPTLRSVDIPDSLESALFHTPTSSPMKVRLPL